MSVEVTQLGLILIPVTVVLLLFLPGFLLPWTFVLVTLQAASVLNIYVGGYPVGVQPGYFAAGLFVVSVFVRLFLKGRLKVPRGFVPVFLPLLAFVVYVVLSALFLPVIFEDSVRVFPPREGIALDSLTPLEPSPTNLSQTVYVIFLALLTAAVSLDFANSAKERSTRFYLGSYLLAGYLVVFVGLYQLGASYLSIPYPYELLYSSPTYDPQYGQTLAGGVKRLSSTFTEPAVASFYLVGVFAFSLWCYLFVPRFRSVYPMCLLSGLALLLTTSTTAYLAMGTVLSLVVINVLVNRKLSYRLLRLASIGVPVVLVAALSLSLLDVSEAVDSVAREALLEKAASVSFSDRVGTALHSLSLLLPTAGFGVGWGSNRSSSLPINTLSNAGLWGSLLLAWFAVNVYRRAARIVGYYRKVLPTIDRDRLGLVQGFAVSVVAMLIAGTISVADLTIVGLWLNLAIFVALIFEAEKRSRETRSSGLSNPRGQSYCRLLGGRDRAAGEKAPPLKRLPPVSERMLHGVNGRS